MVAVGYYLAADTSEQTTPAEPLNGDTQDEAPATSTPERTTTEQVSNGYALSLVVPEGAELSREAERYYKVLYAGPENEDPALTDGYTVTMTLLAKQAGTPLQTFVEDVRADTANAEGATIAEVTVGGRSGLSFTHETELGNGVTKHYVLVDDETVAEISTSIVGENTEQYESAIDDMLSTLTFPQVEEDQETANSDDRIRVTNIEASETITSPLVVEGEARGTWYFEATFPVILVDWHGLIIAEGYAQADGSWMTEDFVPFTAELNFDSPYQTGDPDYMQNGTLILQKANPSGLPENDAAVEIPIQFVPAN